MGGIFSNVLTAPVATGTANVPLTLWSKQIPGGAVSIGNALRLRFFADGSGDGFVHVKLNGEEMAALHVDTDDHGSALVDVVIWRTGTNTAVAETWCLFSVSGQITQRGDAANLNWGSSQALEITGESDVSGGLVLQRAGESH